MTEELAQAWVRGWAVSRGAPVRREDDAWRVTLNAATRDEEYVLINPSPDEIAVTCQRIADPRIWLTILGAIEGPTEGLEVQSRVETLMDAPIMPGQLHPGVTIEVVDGVAHATMIVDGIAAARGQIAVVDGIAVLDRIETHPDFRRQGRGRAVVDSLQSWGYGQGARHSVLLASPDGRALYAALGWRETMPAVTFAGRG